MNIGSEPYRYQPIPSSYAATAIGTAGGTLTVPAAYANITRAAAINVAGAAIRYRDDGTAASASSGYPIQASTDIWYAGDVRKITFAAQSGTATLSYLLYG